MSELTTAMSNRDQYLEELLRTVGNVFQNCPPETKRGAFTHRLSSANGWELPYGANSLTLPSCSHVTVNGLLQEPQTWGPEKAQTYLEWGQHRISGNWYSTVPHSPGWNQTEAWSGAVNVVWYYAWSSFYLPLPAPSHSLTSFKPYKYYSCWTPHVPTHQKAFEHVVPCTWNTLSFPLCSVPSTYYQDSSLTSVSLGSLPWLSKPW